MFKMVLGAQALDTKKSFQSLSSLTEKTCQELKLWMLEILSRAQALYTLKHI